MSSNRLIIPTNINELKSSIYLKKLGLIDIINYGKSNNPYELTKDDNEYEYTMWEEQTYINFPILYLASILLYIHAKQNGCDIFIFATRDCCHWYKIFKKLFPLTKSYYFHCSRNMFEKATSTGDDVCEFDKYVKNIIGGSKNIKKTIFIDIHGTCKRMFHYFSTKYDTVPYGFLLSSTHHKYSKFPYISRHYYKKGRFVNIVFGARGGPCESLNYDIIGTLQNYDENGPVHDLPEYDINLVQPYHDCINFLVDKLNPIHKIINNTLNTIECIDLQDDLISNIKIMYNNIMNSKPIILTRIDHVGKHEKSELNKITEPNKIAEPNKITESNSTPNSQKSSRKQNILNQIKEQTNIINSIVAVDEQKITQLREQILDQIDKEERKEDKENKEIEEVKEDKEIKEEIHYSKNRLHIPFIDFNNIYFVDILCNNTTYGLMWNVIYEEKECVVKMIMIKSGLYYDKYTDYNHQYYKSDDKIPFLHTKFITHKAATMEQFSHEVKELAYLSNVDMAPQFYGHCIVDRGGLHYGFIIMEKVDASVKDIIVNRSLLDNENKLISDLIDKLHKTHNKIHGDMKPSNIGVFLDSNKNIIKCVFLDCQKIRNKHKISNSQFNKLVDDDYDTYKRHVTKNLKK